MSATIDELNREEAKQYIGGVVFVAILMVIGFIGNLHVLLVYAFRMKPSNHRTFILVLGVLDFITCTVGMPFIIVDLRNPLTFTMSSACKILRFINYFICSSSALTLLVIAVDRYRKICAPLRRQISHRLAKQLCLLVLFIALLLSWPAPVLYGIASVPTTDSNTNGSRCFTENKEFFLEYQAYFNCVLIFIVIVITVILATLYILIWRAISEHGRRQKRQTIKPRLKINTGESNCTGYKLENTDDENFQSKVPNTAKSQKDSGVNTSANVSIVEVSKDEAPSRVMREQHHQSTERVRKTTMMFLFITAVFVLSYLPHLALNTITFIDENFVKRISFPEKVVFHTFLYSFFINNMANCFIYGFYDQRFRHEVQTLYKTLLYCRRRSV